VKGTPHVSQVKTTSPKKYCVRPSTGYVDPGSSKDVQVIMQVNLALTIQSISWNTRHLLN